MFSLFHLALTILTLSRQKSLKIKMHLTHHRMTNQPAGEARAETRSLYERAVSATASLTAKYVACG